jgi:hypothetical protein
MKKGIDYSYYEKNKDKWFFNLDKAVINALNLFAEKGLPDIDLGDFKRPLVVGSGNAFETGKILFSGRDAVFATESSYQEILQKIKSIDGAILISASGEKDAPGIAAALQKKGLPRRFLTCNPNASAKKYFKKDEIFEFPSIPEPYTYNTSTYMGMILAKTREDPKKILEFIQKELDPLMHPMEEYSGFVLLVNKKFELINKMLETKFIELFGRNLGKDVFTRDYAEMHATDIVQGAKELTLSFGYENKKVGKPGMFLPLTKDADYGAMMAAGYYFIGKIQEYKPAWFKDNIVQWCQGREKSPLVDYKNTQLH